MKYQYTIDQIATRCGVSITSINNLKKKNQELINANSTRRQRKIYYNQAVMDFFVSYYSPDTEKKIPDEIIDTEQTEEQAENPLKNPSYREEEQQARIDALQAEIDALHAEKDALRKQLEEKEEERKELLRQNGALILTISQLQQEKQLLLPAPRKSIGEKVKGLFRKS